MSSWFSSIAESASSFAGKVKDSMPVLDSEALQKLTLTTPELTAQRQQFAEEERRRNMVRDRLAGLLPWETRDPERDILVDECREAILKLSSSKETFMGPWPMPSKGVKIVKKKHAENHEKEEETVREEGGGDQDEEDEEQEEGPSEESLSRLAKLEPLPALLADFDLDSHVGLIQRLLKQDPQLVTMQSTLSGGGERERIFWKNFFFHCAFTRYEAGLSIDEIWSEEHMNANIGALSAMASAAKDNPTKAGTATVEEETITFESDHSGGGDARAIRANPKAGDRTDQSKDVSAATAEDTSKPAPPKVTRESSDFDMVDDLDEIGVDKDVAAHEADDYELDELEAEIARELED